MRRRRRRFPTLISLLVIVALAAVAAGWWYRRAGDTARTPPVVAQREETQQGPQPLAAVPEAVVVNGTAGTPPPAADEVLTPIGPPMEASASPDAVTAANTPPSGSQPAPRPAGPKNAAQRIAEESGGSPSSNPRIAASLKRYQAGEVLEARQELNRMLEISRDPAEQAELRRHLRRIADETIFSPKVLTGDPLVTTYTIQPGDVLLEIGRQFAVPYEVIMTINGIRDATRIRAGQKIKVPRGPFHARIYKSQFRLDVYLQDLYVRSYPVGLGATQETPEGLWKVKERLTNPTYYPPASASEKRIIGPDDPSNPLGEHWIGLEGIAGNAVGRVGYGIHGTIEPDSIGKAVSLGCIRMHNEDVAFVYQLLTRDRSTVTILP